MLITWISTTGVRVLLLADPLYCSSGLFLLWSENIVTLLLQCRWMYMYQLLNARSAQRHPWRLLFCRWMLLPLWGRSRSLSERSLPICWTLCVVYATLGKRSSTQTFRKCFQFSSNKMKNELKIALWKRKHQKRKKNPSAIIENNNEMT